MKQEREIKGEVFTFDQEGYLEDYKTWNQSLAEALAKEEGIEELTDVHYKIIALIRKRFEATGKMPSIYLIQKELNIEPSLMYKLFPGKPAEKLAKISGVKKPCECF